MRSATDFKVPEKILIYIHVKVTKQAVILDCEPQNSC